MLSIKLYKPSYLAVKVLGNLMFLAGVSTAGYSGYYQLPAIFIVVCALVMFAGVFLIQHQSVSRDISDKGTGYLLNVF